MKPRLHIKLGSARCRAWVVSVSLGFTVACSQGRPREFYLDADTIGIGVGGGVALCPVEDAPRLGPAPLYPDPPPCTEIFTSISPGAWTVLDGAVWAAQNVDSDEPRCVERCNQIRRFGPIRGEAASVLPEPRPLQIWHINERAIVWSEVAEDGDAACRASEADLYCRMDLWRLDRMSGAISRLTSHGQLYPRRAQFGSAGFGVSGDRIAYIRRADDARGDDGARCFADGAPAPEQTGCVSELRLIDVATSTDTVVVEATQLNLHPRIAGDFMVWMRGATVAELALVARRIDGGPLRTLAPKVDNAGNRLEVEHPWVVWREDGRVRAHHLERDETHTLSEPDEPLNGLDLSSGRVVWGDGAGLITLYDLETRRRRVLLDLP